MKLLLCRECGDIVKLLGEERRCRCGHAAGRYCNDWEVEISGTGEVLLLDSAALRQAMLQRHYQPREAARLTVGTVELALPAHPNVRLLDHAAVH
jgi:hypothetical protein